MTARVSVIIPTHGSPDYLDNAIQSVLRQSFMDFELLVVNDNDSCSPFANEVQEIVGQFRDSRIQLIDYKGNQGGSYARNEGIRLSKGEFVCFLDDDDEYAEDRIERCVKALTETGKSSGDKCIGGVYTGCRIINPGGRSVINASALSGSFLVETLACTFQFHSGSNIFVRRGVFKRIGTFDTNFTRHQDYEFLVRYFCVYKLTGIPEVLLLKRNLSRNVPKPKHIRAIKRQYLSRHESILSKLKSSDRNYISNSNLLEVVELSLRSGGSVDWKSVFQELKIWDSRLPRRLLRTLFFVIFSRDERYRL